jgi:hypothetical protein
MSIMGTRSTTMAAEGAFVCRGCDREIEACAFCEADDCGEAICYRCLIVDLRETVPQPHQHGG